MVEVRILTVHGAKGLEASLVFLVDFGTKIFNAQKADKILMKQETNFKKSFIWVPNIHYKLDWLEKENEITKLRAEEEYKRLLYVGMTRAEDALIVCGCHIGSDNKEGKEKKWLDIAGNSIKQNAYRSPIAALVPHARPRACGGDVEGRDLAARKRRRWRRRCRVAAAVRDGAREAGDRSRE